MNAIGGLLQLATSRPSDRPAILRDMSSLLLDAAQAAPVVVKPVIHTGAPAWIVALAAGAIGSVLTLLVGVVSRLRAARGDVRAHNARAADENRQVEAWVMDRTRQLAATMESITTMLAAEGHLYDGSHANALAHAKSQALHEYRDRRWQADLALQRMIAAENRWHRWWRKRDGCEHALTLTSDETIAPFIDRWREPISRAGLEPTSVFDATRQGLPELLTALPNMTLT